MTTNTTANEYETAAADFLSRNGLKFRATLSDSKTPAWAKDGEETGHHYRVTISKEKRTIFRSMVKETDKVTRWSLGTFFTKEDREKAKKNLLSRSIYHAQCTFLDSSEVYREADRLVFDFWNSINAAKKLKEASKELQDLRLQRQNVDQWSKNTFDLNFGDEMAKREAAVAECHPSAYDVLACISGDAYTPETFADFCAEYGYEADSIKALQQFRRCDRFAKRLRAFFTESELQELSEIQ